MEQSRTEASLSQQQQPPPQPHQPSGRQHGQAQPQHWTKMHVSTNKQIISRRRPKPGTNSLFFDNNTHGYRWLSRGWVAEERIFASGRLYRYYYEPYGQQYISKGEVLAALEKPDLIISDD